MKYVAALVLVTMAVLYSGATAQTPTREQCKALKAKRQEDTCKIMMPAKSICVEYRRIKTATTTTPKRMYGAKTTDPMRRLGKSAGVACKATPGALPFGNAKASVQTEGPVSCDSGRDGPKMAKAWKSVSCCAEKTQMEKDCWKAYGAAKTASAGH